MADSKDKIPLCSAISVLSAGMIISFLAIQSMPSGRCSLTKMTQKVRGLVEACGLSNVHTFPTLMDIREQ